MKIIANTEYKAETDPNSQFQQKLKNYLFGNACTYNPEVLATANTTVAKCVGYSNKTITLGLIPYFRYVAPQVDDYLHRRVNYTGTQMDNIISGFALSNFLNM